MCPLIRRSVGPRRIGHRPPPAHSIHSHLGLLLVVAAAGSAPLCQDADHSATHFVPPHLPVAGDLQHVSSRGQTQTQPRHPPVERHVCVHRGPSSSSSHARTLMTFWVSQAMLSDMHFASMVGALNQVSLMNCDHSPFLCGGPKEAHEGRLTPRTPRRLSSETRATLVACSKPMLSR